MQVPHSTQGIPVTSNKYTDHHEYMYITSRYTTRPPSLSSCADPVAQSYWCRPGVDAHSAGVAVVAVVAIDGGGGGDGVGLDPCAKQLHG